jgi:S1-C subfamily serine protease
LFTDEELKAFAGSPVLTRVLWGFLAILVAMCVLPTASSQDCANVVRDYRDSVVSVEIKKTAKDTGAVDTIHGTGFIVDQDGHVLTSRSLLFKEGKDTDPEALRISGAIRSERATKMPMEYLTSSEIGDVAVLRFTDTSQTWRAISLGDPWSIQNGQSICFMGFPLDIEFLMKPGTVTGKGASKGWWYSDIPYNFGAGGAPVFDSRNEKLIGIVGVSVRSEAEARGVGYIVPINLAYPLLQQFANIDIKREAAQTLASGLQGLQPTTGNASSDAADYG